MSKSHKTYTLAITASIGCGKSTVRKCLEELDVPVVDTDNIAHQLLNSPNPIYRAILQRFGDDLVDAPNGPINRKKLGAIIFSDLKAREELNALMHPAIRLVCQQRIRALNADIVALEIPLLFESGQQDEYNEIWAVLAESSVRLKRLMERDSITAEQALLRINAQWAQEKKAALAHRIIDNSGSIADTRKQVIACLAKARVAAKASADKTVIAEASEEYRKILRRFGYISTDQALEQMGDLSTTEHKEANASMTLMVDSTNSDTGDHNKRELQVDVHMVVKQTRSGPPVPLPPPPCPPEPQPDPPPEPDPDPPPEPDPDPPPEPAPEPKPVPEPLPCPQPPPAPVPAPVPPPAPRPPKRKSWCWWIVASILTAVMAFWLVLHPIGTVHDPGGYRLPPPIVQTTPPSTPYTPPTAEPSRHNCPTSDQVMASPPRFILPNLHNNVPLRVVQWKVEYTDGNCGGALVTGKDAAGRAVNVQSYGANFSFEYQWSIAYGPGRVQVDRFETFNNFVGRTIYSYNSAGVLVGIQQLDGNQRLLSDARLNRVLGGLAVALNSYDAASGRSIDHTAVTSTDVQSALTQRFYLFDQFGQLN
jgi:dephospho-CoA kinase